MTTPIKAGTALVTGASSGIGATYADRLARRGHDLVLVARDKARLETLAERLAAETGVKVAILPADLSSEAGVRAVVDRIVADTSISLIVNNAGIGPDGPALSSPPDYLDKMVSLNVTAVNTLTVAAANAFKARGGGTIVNIASVVSLIPERVHATYAASKAFVLALTQSLAAQTPDSGLRFQAVLPGLTRTEIFERAGVDINGLDPSMVMEVGDMVDAALAGLDQGETVTIPSLPDPAKWDAIGGARAAIGPDLSKNKPAARYGVGTA